MRWPPLGDEIKLQTPAECATDQLVVHLDFFHGQPGDLGGRLLGKHRHLGADPQLAGIFAHMGHTTHGFKRRMGQQRLLVNRFELAGRLLLGLLNVAAALGDHAITATGGEQLLVQLR